MSDLPPPPAYPPPAFPPPPYPPPEVAPPPETPKRARGPVLALAAIGVAIIACLAVAVPMLVEEANVDLSDVRSYDDLVVEHTNEDVDYPQSPAVGGPHDPSWLDCGVYDEPVREENAVHDLEHGAVWFSYAPDLDEDEIAELAGLLPQNGIMAPYSDLGAAVVVTVWGRQLELDDADDPRLPLFLQRYGGGETAPEPFGSCAGGIATPGGADATI
jgi:Protein of unknown function (DUF3105)